MIKQFSSNMSSLVNTLEECDGPICTYLHELWLKVGGVKYLFLDNVGDAPDLINTVISSKGGFYNFPDEGRGEDLVSFYLTELSEEEMLEGMVAHANRHKEHFGDFLDLVETQKTVEETLEKDEGDDGLLEALEKVSK